MNYSPTDLNRHLACHHATHLENQAKRGLVEKPHFAKPVMEVLAQRGIEHEEAYVSFLKEQGKTMSEPVDLDDKGREVFKASQARLRDAMESGMDVIVQAHLIDGEWHGYADVLLKVEGESSLGSYHYEPLDTKLTLETKGATILQLCIYSLVLEKVQGVLPERMHVVVPSSGFDSEIYRTADASAYTALAKETLEKFQYDEVETYPYPCGQCQVCDWWQVCENRRREDDHLTLVAGLTTKQALDLEGSEIETLASFAQAKEIPSLRNVSSDVLSRLQEQAKVQLQGRDIGESYYELMDSVPEKGLALLPEPCEGDVFLDFEAARLFEPGGLEYLIGYCFKSESGEIVYERHWARRRSEEKVAFESLLAFLESRIERYPTLRIYHFGGYETGAMKRLMLRHATGIEIVDSFLRSGRFIDLQTVTRQGVRASVERYSLKDLESFHGFKREQDMRVASSARRLYEAALDLETVDDIPIVSLDAIENYNREDCLSTLSLRDWLENVRSEAVEGGSQIIRPELGDGAPSEKMQEFNEEIEGIVARLLLDVPDGAEHRDQEQQAKWLLANLLPYHRREMKVEAWEFFRMSELEPHEYFQERKALGGLDFVCEVEVPGARSNALPVHRYRYPRQEAALKDGNDLYDPEFTLEGNAQKIGSVVNVDLGRQTIDIKKTRKSLSITPSRVFEREGVSARALESSLIDFGRHIADFGFDEPGPWQAAIDLLMMNAPRLRNGECGSLREEGESTVSAATRLCRDLADTVFPIQGPPGTGKSYTSSRVILDLLKSGKKVGVCAVSHKVIESLLVKVVEAADEDGETVACYQKPKSGSRILPYGIQLAKDNKAVIGLLTGSDPVVIGGTSWTWANSDVEGMLDYLFVDEAGQLSLAYALAISRSAKNVVLVGDPQQLEQPQKGSHPDGCEVAALVHLLDGKDTVSDNRGLFLDTTYRMHPSICSYTSELFYEGKLVSHDSCAQQEILDGGRWSGVGLRWVPIDHEGSQSRSIEEIEEVSSIIDDLVGKASWVNQKGETSLVGIEDILIVAPYNLQVNALVQALPTGARVGTVDRFQGQEAAIVIYSMTSSSVEDAPRGMEFLYDPHRLNVATSRARCMAIVVGNPQVLRASCSTPDQVKKVNGVCRIAEIG